MFFLFGVKGGFLFLITKKEKSPLKTSLFSEQQKRFNAGVPGRTASNLAKVLLNFKPKFSPNADDSRQNVFNPGDSRCTLSLL